MSSGYLSAQKPDIVFPVAELDNCKNEKECRKYCDEPDNIKACVEFAEKHGLMSKEEVKKARKFAEIGTGPGNCKGKDECETFCSDPDNMEVCIDFAEKHGLIDDKELDEAKKVSKVLKEGGKLPGGCKTKNTCEQYCSNLDHAEECLNFAEKAGFIPKEELEQARKFLPLMQRGETPGGCKTKDQCEEYCHQEQNINECAEFGLKIGAMSKEDYEMFKKTGGKGPGGCKGRECETFCNDPANQEVCLKFAEENGFIEKDKIEEVRKGTQQLKEHFTNMPPEVLECLNNAIGAERFQKIKNGEIVPGPDLGRAMHQCFEAVMKNGQMGRDERGGENRNEDVGERGEFKNTGKIQGGPGGCSSPEECRKYCDEHKDECRRPMMDDNHMRPMPLDEQFKPDERGEGYRPMPPPSELMNKPYPSYMPPKEGYPGSMMPPNGEHPDYMPPKPMDGQYQPPSGDSQYQSAPPPTTEYKSEYNQPQTYPQPTYDRPSEPIYQAPPPSSDTQYQSAPPAPSSGESSPPPSTTDEKPSSMNPNKFLGSFGRYLLGN